MMTDRTRIFFGYFEQEETEVILFPAHEEVFAYQELYLNENLDLSEEADETVYSAGIIPTISFPLQMFHPDWEGRGYFLYQDNVENEYLQYSLDDSAKIKSVESAYRCFLEDDLGGQSFEDLQIYLADLRRKKRWFCAAF
ncbi:MAG: hypothetical protein HC913_22350 [Microscillaceae bacterium]|nr:hypothetical protein [Microscillaceae bacterium]